MLRFIIDKKFTEFDLESWDYVRENGGLKTVIEKLGYEYDDIYGYDALKESIKMLSLNTEKYSKLIGKFKIIK